MRKKDLVENHKVFSLTAKQWREIMAFPAGNIWMYQWQSNGEMIASLGYSIESSGSYIHVRYSFSKHRGEDQEDVDYVIPIDRTPCTYGGFRNWFRCPLMKNGVPCGRRVKKLYAAHTYLGCRHCYELTYRSAREHDKRLSELINDPQKEIAMLNNPSFRTQILALRAYFDRKLKLERLERRVKRRMYAGRPTRQYRRYLQSFYQLT